MFCFTYDRLKIKSLYTLYTIHFMVCMTVKSLALRSANKCRILCVLKFAIKIKTEVNDKKSKKKTKTKKVKETIDIISSNDRIKVLFTVRQYDGTQCVYYTYIHTHIICTCAMRYVNILT